LFVAALLHRPRCGKCPSIGDSSNALSCGRDERNQPGPCGWLKIRTAIAYLQRKTARRRPKSSTTTQKEKKKMMMTKKTAAKKRIRTVFSFAEWEASCRGTKASGSSCGEGARRHDLAGAGPVGVPPKGFGIRPRAGLARRVTARRPKDPEVSDCWTGPAGPAALIRRY
jgi:hypothetical protein